jgi:sugar phosphate permease
MSPDEHRAETASLRLRNPVNLAGGVLLFALGGLAFWLARDLDPGTLREMGPGMMPRWLAAGVALCGLALLVSAFLVPRAVRDENEETVPLRGPLLVVAAILVFAATIRPLAIGTATLPGLGLAAAGPLSLLIAGYATPEARFRELLALAFGLTAFCMILFGDVLNQPIPIMPRALADMFPAGWSEKAILRATAALLAALALAAFLMRPRPSSGQVSASMRDE